MRGADTARIGGREARISAFGQLFYREKEQSEKFCLYLQPRKDDKRRSRRGRKAGLPPFRGDFGEMPEWSIGPHSKCGVRATVPGVRIPLSPQTTGWSAGLQTFVCNLFYFRGGQIYPERSEDKSWSYGWQAKIRSSQGRLRSNGGKDGRHAVTRSRAGSAEEWKRGEMLYGSTAFLCLQRGKVVRISYGVCIEREAVKGLASFLSSENRIFGNDF